MQAPLIAMSEIEMIAEVIRLRALNQELTLRQERRHSLSLKVSPKGAVSVYGLQRWPVTLYSAQWRRLIANSQALEDFIIMNAARLAVKEQQ